MISFVHASSGSNVKSKTLVLCNHFAGQRLIREREKFVIVAFSRYEIRYKDQGYPVWDGIVARVFAQMSSSQTSNDAIAMLAVFQI